MEFTSSKRRKRHKKSFITLFLYIKHITREYRSDIHKNVRKDVYFLNERHGNQGHAIMPFDLLTLS